jgi:hypothetical protein
MPTTGGCATGALHGERSGRRCTRTAVGLRSFTGSSSAGGRGGALARGRRDPPTLRQHVVEGVAGRRRRVARRPAADTAAAAGALAGAALQSGRPRARETKRSQPRRCRLRPRNLRGAATGSRRARHGRARGIDGEVDDYPSYVLDTGEQAPTKSGIEAFEADEPELFDQIFQAAEKVWPYLLQRKRECPPWDGGPDRVVEGDEVVYVKSVALPALRGLNVASGANRALAEALEQTNVMDEVRAVDIVERYEARGIVFYLPFYEDQRMGPSEGEAEIGWVNRWRVVATILSALVPLSLTQVTIGFQHEGRTFSYSWFEYRMMYADAPEFIAVLLEEDES